MIQKKLKSFSLKKELQKLKEQFKEFIHNPKEIISFFIPIIIAIILIIPVPYTVTVGGGTINMDEKIKIVNSYENKGSLNSAYVKELQGRVITYLLAKLIPNYELTPIEEVTLDNETSEEYNYREKTYFTSSLDSAAILAYQKAGKNVKIINQQVYVLYVLKDAETNLKVKDHILEIDNKKIDNIKMLTSLLQEYAVGEKVSVKVLRNNKEESCYFKVQEMDDEKRIGIYLNSKYIYEVDPPIEFEFSNRESGPSGGLMITLTIYNKLVPEDITRGKKVVGTGTIDRDGKVGEIGGIAEKLQGAVKSKADIFIVPQANYQEALAIKNKNRYNIKLIEVSTFDETLEKLKEIRYE